MNRPDFQDRDSDNHYDRVGSQGHESNGIIDVAETEVERYALCRCHGIPMVIGLSGMLTVTTMV